MEKHIEKIARAFRDSIFTKPVEDLAWASCRENWIKDSRAFLSKLEAAGLQIVEVKPIARSTREAKETLSGL